MDDDILRKAAGAASAADTLLTPARGDPLGEELRRAAEAAASGSRGLRQPRAPARDRRRCRSRASLRRPGPARRPRFWPSVREPAGRGRHHAAVRRRHASRRRGRPRRLSGAFSPGAELRSLIGAAAEAQRIQAELFRMPQISEPARLTEAASAGALARAAFGADLSGLRAAMEAVRAPWLREGRLLESALGFGELQAMGALLRREPPFAEAVSSALRLDLGDWRDEITMPMAPLRDPAERSRFYAGRGLNRALTDFTPRAFDESLEAAGLTNADEAAGGDAEDGEEAGLARARAAFNRLQRFEREVRRFVDRAMSEAFGEAWIKQRTPAGMRDDWIRKRDTAVARGETAGPLIQYADFTDYKAIIERADNWDTVFRNIFGRQEDVRESFQRLFPVRLCTMHARIVTLDDEIYLISETTRLLRAIRKAD